MHKLEQNNYIQHHRNFINSYNIPKNYFQCEKLRKTLGIEKLYIHIYM